MRTMTIYHFDRTPAHNEAVLRQAGCASAEIFVRISECASRPSLCEPPPERKAAGTVAASRTVRWQTDIVKRKVKTIMAIKLCL
jgi:hypothetical protein